ncbi:nucleoid-associated protein [Ferrimonas sp. YFM]|uniref:nucleoid-associated protein n=1 Tax=Ferrimonas sp. YFM TaxID=3028878 RepID=UPI002572A30B|nr:nucleoid-associated protein [Ferrimonas sp. YFM]BDY04882.1 hypothetical protein F0521_19230 [Ferrimonas sp. YFM]
MTAEQTKPCIACGHIISTKDLVCTHDGCGAAQLQPHSCPMTICSAIAGALTKERSASFSCRVGDEWPVSQSDASSRFVVEVEQKFSRKNKFHSHFADDCGEANSFPRILKRYLQGDLDVQQLTSQLMFKLRSAALDTSGSKPTGGNVVVTHYKKSNDIDDAGRLLIVMVTQTDGFKLDPTTIIPQEIDHIDLKALRQAAMIDLTQFDAVYPEKPADETYLHFIQGHSSAEFFKAALGCDVDANNKTSIKNFFEALHDFCKSADLETDLTDQLFDCVEHAMVNLPKDRDFITKDELVRVVESELREGGYSAEGAFSSYLEVGDYKVNDYIEPTNLGVKKGQEINIKGVNGIGVQIKMNLIGGKDSDKAFCFNPDTKEATLTFTVDEADVEQLNELI